MDEADRAEAQGERLLAARLAALRRRATRPEVEADGACLWCDAPLDEGRRWCDADCRDHWERARGRR